MSIPAGTRLGAYEIQSTLGEGGMGQVYKARDTRLDRIVAIKVLSPMIAGDPEFRARFEREAKTISQLQHPHICTLHDVGLVPDPVPMPFLVMEYLEGETLADRITTGRVPLAEALKIAIQISDALDKAHRLGIVHRDLKPGNVMLTRTGAKLLDFGLAKSMVPSGSGDDLAAAMTRTTPLTGQGTILGTFQYMAPEQIEGADADARSDIWAFGCLLHEMLTGQRTFEGKSRAGLIGAILKDEVVPVSSRVPLASSALDHVVATCLAKDPDERWQSVADITRELTWIVVSKAEAVTPSAGTSRTRERLAWAGGLAATAALVMWLNPFGVASPSADIAATRSVIQLDDGLHARAWQGVSSPGPVLSPDGRVLAYRAADANLLALRDMATGLTRVVPDTAEGMELFFSPDSRQLGFVTGGTIWRVALGGGERVKVFDGVSLLTRGATWADDGFIYYTPNFSSGLWRVSEDGSAPEELTTLDPDRAEKSHRYPFVLPGSRAVLFVVATARDATFDDATIEVLELEGRVRRTLVDRGTAPRYSPTGHLLYSRGSSLVAVPFDLESLETTGDPVVVAENVMARSAYGGADVTLSTTGSLVTIRPHAPVVTQFLAVQRDGTAETIAEIAGSFTEGRVSPDGTRLATWKIAATSQISILDLDTGRLSPLTFEWDNESLLWSADGSRLIAQSTSGGSVTNLLAFPAFGPGPPARLTTSANIQQVGWRSAYGSIVPFVEVDPKTGPDIWTLDLASGSARPILQTPFDEWAPALSWNGKWLAYTSNQSGEQVVLVQAYPSGGRTWPVSRGTGAAPHWHPNGRELIYRDGDAVVSVPFTEDATFRPGSPVTLFEWNDRMFDVLEDGRFLMRRQDVPPPVAQFDLVVNWFSELRQKMAGAAR